jgi:ParB family chromosome partitioning protein
MSKSKDDTSGAPAQRARKKRALGKGLSALIPDMGGGGAESGIEPFSCPIDRIRPNRYQPRIRFDEAELEELSRSIRQQGVIQPLLVRREGGAYELIAGERRLRAARSAGLSHVPVLIRDVGDETLLEMSIVENIQREDLNPMEEAEAYHHLMDRFSLTQEEVAAKVGKSRSAVANILRLRQLPGPIRAALLDDTLSMGHARALLGARNAAVQNAAWRKIAADGLSVREAERLVKRLNQGQPASPAPQAPTADDAFFSRVAEELSRHFGTKVQIRRRGRKGNLVLEFYSDEDLERLLQQLKAV